MTTLIVSLHVIVCVLLVLIVLLQGGKGAEMGVSIGGGAGQTMFGAASPANILTKITTGVAIIFMLTSLVLAYLSGTHKGQETIMENKTKATTQEQSKQPVEQKDVSQ